MNKITRTLVETYRRRRFFQGRLSSAIDAVRRAIQVLLGK